MIDYQLPGVADAEPIYRLITTLLDSGQYLADELAALYHERWRMETTFAEIKTTLKGADIVLRSKTPELVRQEFWGLVSPSCGAEVDAGGGALATANA